MTELLPIVTTTLGATPDITAKLIAGLNKGIYERSAGIVRRADNKRIVAWLRDVAEGQSIDSNVLSKFSPLLQLNVAASVLNLSITAISFAVVLNRLNSIENQLTSISKILADINRKIDLSINANFRAALRLAASAFRMNGDSNKLNSANQAIDRFLEAEEIYSGMLDNELHVGSPAIMPFFNILFLAYASAARCYLELNNTEEAWRHLQQGDATLSSRVKQFYDSIIAVNPAIFLHPALADTITLERLTRLMRHYDESLTESSVFESVRKVMWETASENLETWLRKLPAYIWKHDVGGRKKVNPVTMMQKGVRQVVPHLQDTYIEETLRQVLPCVREAFSQVEDVQESIDCIEGYGMELKYLIDHNIEFATWEQIELPTTGPDDPVTILLPEDSELMAS